MYIYIIIMVNQQPYLHKMWLQIDHYVKILLQYQNITNFKSTRETLNLVQKC